MDITRKTAEEIKLLREGGYILGNILHEIVALVQAGLSTEYLNTIFEEKIIAAGGKPSFKGYHGFPAGLCISLNEEIVHGIPGKRIIKEGDVVGIDSGMIYKGLYTDTAYTVAVGEVKPNVKKLIEVTKSALYAGIDACKLGATTGDIGAAIEKHIIKFGNNYGIVRGYCGHGVGHAVHEAPDFPNYGTPGRGPALEKGWVFALEPMVNIGTENTRTKKDNWTVVTTDGKPSAHFEHTLALDYDGQIIIITDPAPDA